VSATFDAAKQVEQNPQTEPAVPIRQPVMLASRLLQTDVLALTTAVVLALAVGVGLIYLGHANPVAAYKALFSGAFGSSVAIGDTLVEAIPLTLISVGIAIGFRGGVFNVGAEGQLLLGATAAAVVGLHVGSLGGAGAAVLMAAAAIVTGAAWALIAGLLKVALRASEVLNTLMLNYVAIYLIDYLLNGPIQDPNSPLAQTASLPPVSQLPIIWPGTTLYAGIFVAAASVLICHVLLWRTAWGFRLRLMGRNAVAARSFGIDLKRLMLGAFALSGGLAGLAGYCVVAGVQHQMITGLSPGWGYTAIVIALLGRTSPLAVSIAAFFFAALDVGASSMETAVQVPASMVTTIQYLVVLFVIARNAIQILPRRSAPEA
jgi:simple sugar transport system permease protein